jgi:hypothetical protein
LNDDDVILISQALKSNTSLKTIDLLSNNVTSVGVNALLNCVFDSSSLNAISESNHTLKTLWLFSDIFSDRVYYLSGCVDKLLELDRTEKILFALQDKDSLLKYLVNVSVELISAEVLAFPHEWVEHQHDLLHRLLSSCKHLNIVYSTMLYLYYCNYVKSSLIVIMSSLMQRGKDSTS